MTDSIVFASWRQCTPSSNRQSPSAHISLPLKRHGNGCNWRMEQIEQTHINNRNNQTRCNAKPDVSPPGCAFRRLRPLTYTGLCPATHIVHPFLPVSLMCPTDWDRHKQTTLRYATSRRPQQEPAFRAARVMWADNSKKKSAAEYSQSRCRYAEN